MTIHDTQTTYHCMTLHKMMYALQHNATQRNTTSIDRQILRLPSTLVFDLDILVQQVLPFWFHFLPSCFCLACLSLQPESQALEAFERRETKQTNWDVDRLRFVAFCWLALNPIASHGPALRAYKSTDSWNIWNAVEIGLQQRLVLSIFNNFGTHCRDTGKASRWIQTHGLPPEVLALDVG